ncbi:hypothetical protein C8J57DRAFT_1710852 [Mycena rebaudengoi]|nr:hypothetical protein C8J57DRAFT_1710852 [Mycena rebaudengoi]
MTMTQIGPKPRRRCRFGNYSRQDKQVATALLLTLHEHSLGRPPRSPPARRPVHSGRNTLPPIPSDTAPGSLTRTRRVYLRALGAALSGDVILAAALLLASVPADPIHPPSSRSPFTAITLFAAPSSIGHRARRLTHAPSIARSRTANGRANTPPPSSNTRVLHPWIIRQPNTLTKASTGQRRSHAPSSEQLVSVRGGSMSPDYGYTAHGQALGTEDEPTVVHPSASRDDKAAGVRGPQAGRVVSRAEETVSAQAMLLGFVLRDDMSGWIHGGYGTLHVPPPSPTPQFDEQGRRPQTEHHFFALIHRAPQ